MGSSLTTSSVSLKLVPKYLLCWVVFHLLSVTNQPWPLTWVLCRNVLPPPRKDPSPATTFSHLDATTVLSRQVAELGFYPAVDPLESSSRIMDHNIAGLDHYDCARRVKKTLQDHKSLQDIIAILGMGELSQEEKLTVQRARKNPKIPLTTIPGR